MFWCAMNLAFIEANLPLINLAFMALVLCLFLVVLLIVTMAKKQQARLIAQLQSDVSQQATQHEVNAKLQQQSQQQASTSQQVLVQSQHDLKIYFEQQQADLKLKLLRQLNEIKEQFNNNQLKAVDQLVEHLNKTSLANREELAKSMIASSEQMNKRIEQLTEQTDKRLQDISGQVEKRLADGFEKTTKTFNDILKRLALIDDAQKKITELSTNVVSLQEVLADKRSRGAFGEVQLNALIRNVLPEQHFKLQHTLSNGKIADCVLFLPEPTGNVVIDAKFPLESYRKMMDEQAGEFERNAAQRQFKLDIKKHINDISGKYLIEKEI